MSKLLELAQEAGRVMVAVSLADLIECNEELIARAKQELEQAITDAATETYPSVAKVAEMLDVDKSTLWRWAKCGYLVPIEVGGKRRYRMSDVKAILEGGMFRNILDKLESIDGKIVARKQRVHPLDGDALLDNQDMCQLLGVTKRTLARYRQRKDIAFPNSTYFLH